MGIITYWQRESTVLVLEASIKFSTLTFEYTSDANVTPCQQSNARNRGVGVPLLPFLSQARFMAKTLTLQMHNNNVASLEVNTSIIYQPQAFCQGPLSSEDGAPPQVPFQREGQKYKEFNSDSFQ